MPASTARGSQSARLHLARYAVALAPALLLLACSSGNSDPDGTSSSGGSGGAASTGGSGGVGPIGGDRPVTVHVPPSYDPATPTPLVIMLHGYGASGAIEEFYLDITPAADARGFLYAHPDGTLEAGAPSPKRFWNATDACCNFYGSTGSTRSRGQYTFVQESARGS